MKWGKIWPKLAKFGLGIAKLFAKGKTLTVLELGEPVLDAIQQEAEKDATGPKRN